MQVEFSTKFQFEATVTQPDANISFAQPDARS